MNTEALLETLQYAKQNNMWAIVIIVKQGKDHKINIDPLDIQSIVPGNNCVKIIYGSGNMFTIDTTDVIGVQVAKHDNQKKLQDDFT